MSGMGSVCCYSEGLVIRKEKHGDTWLDTQRSGQQTVAIDFSVYLMELMHALSNLQEIWKGDHVSLCPNMLAGVWMAHGRWWYPREELG